LKEDKIKTAVLQAMQGKWKDAIKLNQEIISENPNDVDAYNRLGKAFSEIGEIKKSKNAFGKALELSPQNVIAKKNLTRINLMVDTKTKPKNALPSNLIVSVEKSTITTTTSLVNIASSETLLTLSGGQKLEIITDKDILKINNDSGQYIGQIEPKIGLRLSKLIKGGNKYDVTVISVTQEEVIALIKEIFKHPSQANIISFPVIEKNTSNNIQTNSMDFEFMNQNIQPDQIVLKDWSNDDTEPGDDEAYAPTFHRLSKSIDENTSIDENSLEEQERY
tara:strand:- start:12558 stop:13391 length:834 start_codon:yes stop_codon:yes gene_type:complete